MRTKSVVLLLVLLGVGLFGATFTNGLLFAQTALQAGGGEVEAESGGLQSQGCQYLQVEWSPYSAGSVNVNPPPDCGGNLYTAGTVVTLTAVPGGSFSFLQWNVFPPVGGTMSPTLVLTMDNDYTADAIYDAASPPPPPGCRLLIFDKDPFPGGEVSVSPDPNCGATWYIRDDVVTLTAVPNSGYTFLDWSGTVSTTNPVLNIIMSDNHTVTANFEGFACYQIFTPVTPMGAGSVIVSPSTPPNCPNGPGWTEGSPVILIVEANVGYQFDHWNAPGEIYDGSTNNPLVIGAGELTHTLNLEAEFLYFPPEADLYIQKADSVDPATLGQPFTYTLTIGNNGPDSASDVRVIDALPLTLTPISASPSQGNCGIGGTQVICTIGVVPDGVTQTVDIVVMPIVAGTITNTANVFNNDPTEVDNNPGNNTATETTLVLDQPVSGLSAVNDSPTVLGMTTALTASVAGGTNVSYLWDFGDGNGGSGANVGHTYAAPGLYTATVTATNTANMMTATTAVLIEEAIGGLTAHNDSPTTLGLTTTLTATISAGTNVTYTWDFGDGSGGAGIVVTHIYTASGTYTATITATNAVGFQVATTVVTIVEPGYTIYLPVVVGKP